MVTRDIPVCINKTKNVCQLSNKELPMKLTKDKTCTILFNETVSIIIKITEII